MDKPHRVDDVQEKPAKHADILRLQRVVIAGIGIGNATAPRRDALQRTGKERFEEDGQRSRLRQLLHVNKLVRGPQLPSGNDVLYLGDDHRNDGEGFADAGGLGDHACPHHLRLDLVEAGEAAD